jgi:hypothetical protein
VSNMLKREDHLVLTKHRKREDHTWSSWENKEKLEASLPYGIDVTLVWK